MGVCWSTAEILQANDSLTQVINLYRQLVKGEEVNGDSSTTPSLKGNHVTTHTHTRTYVTSTLLTNIHRKHPCTNEVLHLQPGPGIHPFFSAGSSTALLDLSGLDTSPSAPTFPEFPSQPTPSQELGISLLDDELMSLGEG